MYQVQLRQGDEFVVWTRPPGDSAAPYRAARVLVGPPGAESLQVVVGGESEYRPFPERVLWVVDATEAAALLERTRGGGSAADDEP